MAGDRVLQQGFGRLVVLEAAGDVVRKTFLGLPAAEGQARAREEHERLTRCHAALAAVDGARCPRPLGLLHDPPGLRMQRAPGRALYFELGRGRIDDDELRRLAGVLARVVHACGAALGRPLPDLNLENLLYDAASGELTVVDLGLPQDHVDPEAGATPDEVALGDLLGSTVFESVRPGHVLARRRHRDAARLCALVVEAAAGLDGAVVRPEPLARAAVAAYRRCAFGRGAATTAWYAVAGPALARRIRTGHGTFGPAPAAAS